MNSKTLTQTDMKKGKKTRIKKDKILSERCLICLDDIRFREKIWIC